MPLHIELIPIRPAIRTDGPVTLDLLVRVVPPAINSATSQRPPLNLALVLDRSGSMAGGNKLGFAREAAVFAVQQLLPEDRVSVTVFDDDVQTVVPSTKAQHKQPIIDRINTVQPGGSTALHAGWTTGAGQVREFLVPNGLNRVLLLTDGLANVGETNPDSIATDVKRFAAAGVSTTTLGVGRDYNEDLLEAMARSGDGNYYFIESAQQLADIFQTELRGLMATVGRGLKLALEPAEGVRVADILNELERDADGLLVLPNLVIGMPIEIVLRLNIAPRSLAEGSDLLRFRLAWIDPKEGPQVTTAALRLPAVSAAQYESLAPDVVVVEQVGLQMAARAKREATAHMERGEQQAALSALGRARDALAGVPRTSRVEQEERDQATLQNRCEEGDLVTSAKMAKYQRYCRAHTKPTMPQDTTEE
jgi:Ca-activated chloride channel family protein